jgi:tetratricopeptide (TPR) repeat protein
VADGVSAGAADALLPVVYLHYLADEHYLNRGEGWLVSQNREWVRELVQRWIDRGGGGAEGRRFGAQLLASMGATSYALELDPSNELALLRRVALAEKGSRPEDALMWLGQLLEAHPQSHQGRLRKAVVLRKYGQPGDARKLLRGLVDDSGSPQWVVVLAYQELALIERDERRHDRAEALLREAVARIPAQELYLQLAYYLDERQRPDDAVAALNQMPSHAGTSAARHLYNAPPQEELQRARQQVAAQAAAGVSQLRLALGGAAAADTGSRR